MTSKAKPDSLENKFRLMQLVPFDKRMKRKHILVYGFILDWFHSKYGDALASSRHVLAELKERDPFGAGLYMGDVHSALTELVAWGYLAQEKGSGRRASRYIPVWSKFDSVQKIPNATEDEISVRETPNTSVLGFQNATNDSVHKIPNEDPSTGPGPQTRGQVVEGMFDAAPVAPPAAALKGATAGPASGGDRFDEFWQSWPRKHGKKAAQSEWRKITYDVDVIIASAGVWAEHYARHGVDKRWIPEPANWLRGERWDEDLPIVHIDAKGAAITKAKANAPAKTAPEPANDNAPVESEDVPEFMKGSPSLWPVGDYCGEFVENDIVDEYEGKDIAAHLTFEVQSPGPHYGKRFLHKFYMQSFIKTAQDEGNQYLSDITSAIDLPGEIQDLDELMFIPVRVKADGRKLMYSRIEKAA